MLVQQMALLASHKSDETFTRLFYALHTRPRIQIRPFITIGVYGGRFICIECVHLGEGENNPL